MSELSFPTAGGGSVTDSAYERLVGSYAPSGLYGGASTAPSLVYGDATGRHVKVRANRAATVQGFHWETDGAGLTRDIDANTSGHPRLDLAVLRLNRADWTVTFQIVKGTPATVPVLPSPTQTIGTTGVYEVPLAAVSVPNGSTTVTAVQVQDRAPYISAHSFSVAGKGTPPPGEMHPLLVYAADVNRLYAYLDGNYQIVGESTTLTKLDTQGPWNTGNVYARRWNGFTYFQALVTRTGSPIAANTESPILLLPATYRPSHDITGVGFCAGRAVRWRIDGVSGVVTLLNYDFTINTGELMTLHPMVWASNNS